MQQLLQQPYRVCSIARWRRNSQRRFEICERFYCYCARSDYTWRQHAVQQSSGFAWSAAIWLRRPLQRLSNNYCIPALAYLSQCKLASRWVCLIQDPQYLARELRRLIRRQIVLKLLTDWAVSFPQRRQVSPADVDELINSEQIVTV